MASYRYRAKIPAEQIGADINGGEAEIAVFSKPMDGDIDLAKSIKSQGCKIVLDICDDHLSLPLYQDMLKLADLVTCGTEEMRRRIGKGEIIPDPYEEEETTPHTQGNKALWFGHQINYPDIEAWKPHLKGLDLHIMTGPRQIAGCSLWSLENQHKALKESNIVLLPVRKGVEHKTSNRLLNALRAGCFPICSHHPSYEEFRQFAWLGDPHTAIRWLSEFSSITDEIVKAGQDYIRDKYSPETIGKRWKEVLGSI